MRASSGLGARDMGGGAVRTFLLTVTLSFIASVSLGREPASAGTIPLITLTTGNEVIEDFSSQTPEYEFQVDTAGTVLFYMAFGGTDQYKVQFVPGPNSSFGTLPSSVTEQGPISTHIFGQQSYNAGYSSGSLNIFVTDENATASGSLAGFEISNNSSISLDIPTATPIPGALPLFAAGLGAMGFLAKRRKRKNDAAIAAA
jgi:hypothetical protein